MTESRFLESVDYEVACEMLAERSGLLTTELLSEEGKAIPDLAKIEALRTESQTLWDQKVALRPDDTESIQRVFDRYGKSHGE